MSDFSSNWWQLQVITCILLQERHHFEWGCYNMKSLNLFASFQAWPHFPIPLPTLFQEVPYHVLPWGLLPRRWDPQTFMELPHPIIAVEPLEGRDHSWSCWGFVLALSLPSVSTSHFQHESFENKNNSCIIGLELCLSQLHPGLWIKLW